MFVRKVSREYKGDGIDRGGGSRAIKCSAMEISPMSIGDGRGVEGAVNEETFFK